MIRTGALALLIGLLTGATAAQDVVKPVKTPPRFGFSLDEFTYPQNSPADALKSIVKAIDRKRVDYMLAHLIDPGYVDYWIVRYKDDFPQVKEAGKALLAFDRLTRETQQYYQDDPLILKDLRAFAGKAEWMENENTAVGTVAAIPARKVFMRRINNRWFLENRQN
jgi:hypothetical protein